MIMITGSDLAFAEKVPCWCASKQTWIRISAPRGTNANYPEGIEVGRVLEAIKQDVSCYTDQTLFVYAVAPTDKADTDSDAAPGDPTSTPLWHEYVIHKGTRLFISTTEFVDLASNAGDRSPSDAPGVDSDPNMKYQTFIQDLVKWIPISVPNPAFGKDAKVPHSNCTARTLKKCVISTLGHPADFVNKIRIFRNSNGYAKGDQIIGTTICWPNAWYYVVLSDTAKEWRSHEDRVAAIGRWPTIPGAAWDDDDEYCRWEQVPEEEDIDGPQ